MSSDEHRESASTIVARCAVITCSDSRTAETDTSGAYIRGILRGNGHDIIESVIIPDEPARIRSRVESLVDMDANVILINGGTGITARDTTFDTITQLLDKPLPGFGELFRMLSFEEIGAASMLSRATAGVIGSTLLFSMPGSTPAVRLAMDRLIIPELRHLVRELNRTA